MLIILSQQDWFGAGDSYAFILWTVPLSLGIAFSADAILYLYRNFSFAVRLLLITISAAALSFLWTLLVHTFLGAWFGAFSIPVFYLWVAGSLVQLLYLNWLMRKHAIVKKPRLVLKFILLPVIPIASVLIIFSILHIRQQARKQRETYLIPADLDGAFRVIYEKDCGIIPEEKDGRKILVVPSNRILILKQEFEPGFIDQEFYFVDGKGNRIRAKDVDYYQDKDLKRGIALGGTGTRSGGPDSITINYAFFMVFNDTTKEITNSDYDLSESVMDSIMVKQVKECRNK
jgi:hypothetical protein